MRASSTRYQITVDYSLSVEQAVAQGRYDWSEPAITCERCLPQNSCRGQVQVVVGLVCFNLPIKSDQAIVQLDRCGLRPAQLSELLALGAQYPEQQRQYPIVALGSVWSDQSGCQRVLLLGVRDFDRTLELGEYGGGCWDADVRFAAIRK
jgi:hypothetical protein